MFAEYIRHIKYYYKNRFYAQQQRNISEAPKEKSEEAKRTTIILEKSEREFIESLIKEGKEPGIKPLISKMLDIYKSMMIYDWHFPGEYYCGISRTAFVNVELLNILNPADSQRKMAMKSVKRWVMP